MNTIRLATPSDAASILEIYAPYILNTSVTFETEVPSEDVFKERIKAYMKTWPWLVCEIDEVFAGYAYASRYRERESYQWSVESSVYVNDAFHGKGVAGALYKVLFEILKYQGFRNVYAVINLPNEKSVHFHEKFGFKWFANYENVGYKLGKWKTVGWWQLSINEYSDKPASPLNLNNIDSSLLEEMINEANK